MRSLRYALMGLMPLTACAVLIFSGCKGEPSKEPTRARVGPTKAPEVAGYAKAIRGKVVWDGDGIPKVLTMPFPKDNQDAPKCPADIPVGGIFGEERGWFVNPGNKGVRYTLVFLKPPKGFSMPPVGDEAKKLPKDKDGKEIKVVVMGQPHCQFEPRVISLHPDQKLQFINDSEKEMAHDSKLQGPNDYQKSLAWKDKTEEIDLRGKDTEPNVVSCAKHQGIMSAFIWKMTHPYAVVTDENGEFELKDVPVLKGDQMILTVWNEALPDKFKEIKPIDVRVGEEKVEEIKIK